MNYVVTLLLGLVVGAGVMYLRPVAAPAEQVRGAWTIVTVANAQNDAAWKLNTVTGEVQYCLLNGVSIAGCVKVRQAESLMELSTPGKAPSS